MSLQLKKYLIFQESLLWIVEQCILSYPNPNLSYYYWGLPRLFFDSLWLYRPMSVCVCNCMLSGPILRNRARLTSGESSRRECSYGRR